MFRWKALVAAAGVAFALIPASQAADSPQDLQVKVFSVTPGPRLPHVDLHGMPAPFILTEQVVFAVAGPSSAGFRCTVVLRHDHKLVSRGGIGGVRVPVTSTPVELTGKAKPFKGKPSNALVRCVTAVV